MPLNIGPLEIGVVLVIALLVFGPKRLPELGSSMGRGIREFTKSISGDSAQQPALTEGGHSVEREAPVVGGVETGAAAGDAAR
jgi:sec-independent protein translocase protein TatA